MIAIKDLSFGYAKRRNRQPYLFSHLDLDLKPGNIYGLLGRNGAGKTTLLKLICGLRFPKEGECRVMGFPPEKRHPGLLEEIFLIPEEFYVPPLAASVHADRYSAFYPRFDRSALSGFLNEFEIPEDKRLSDLSYGQRKKYILAFGLATGCRLLLLDEPTNGLDIPSKSQFRKLLASESGDDRIILISTHQVRDMENLIDPIIILDEGQIIFQQSTYDVSLKMSIRLEQDEPEPESVLYWDKTLGGYLVVRANENGEETKVDLEVLFNTVIANREKVRDLFSGADRIKEGEMS